MAKKAIRLVKERNNHILIAIFILLLLGGNYLLGYHIPREDFQFILPVYFLSFLGLLGLFWKWKGLKNWLGVFILGLFLRLILVNATPLWSEDFARFLWDGEVVLSGENPYEFTPNQWMLNEELVDSTRFFEKSLPLLNSPDYFSVYPPLNQLLFATAAFFSKGDIDTGIRALRVILLVAEIGVFLLFLRIFRHLAIPARRVIFYWLNPFVIQEITGNLHFEGLVLFFLLACIWALTRHKKFLSGTFWGLAVSTKLLPLILLPSLFLFRRTRAHAFFWIGAILAISISFLPLIWEDAWGNFIQTLQLYQGKFEFNASIYYLGREIGYWIEGYNTIYYLTKILSGITLVWILYMSIKRRPQRLIPLIDLWVGVYLLYFLFQPVVHPWYVLPLLGLSLFVDRISPLVWSFSLIFSYQAYGEMQVEEKPIWLFLEYGILSIALAWDYFPIFKEKLSNSMHFKKLVGGLLVMTLIAFWGCEPKEQRDARRIIEEAIEAHGGQENWDGLAEISFRKWTQLLLEDGSVEKETDQSISFTFHPEFSGKISWIQDSVEHVLSFSNSKTHYSIAGNPIENPDFLASKKKDFDAAYYAFAQPWKLLEEEGSVFSSEGIRQTPLGEAAVVRVEYGEGNDVWWYYFDPVTKKMIGNEIQLSDHRSLVENIDFNQVSPFTFYRTRKSYRINQAGEKLYLRADYLYDNFEFKFVNK
ncbi:DUF2029 domain-containing protein [Algoriphagus kandeliae]|uniref:DUF2029 domain-containing protein n=1 Tax=Algoriphagus kandeliae TaxID=2562278 RepID=A0A4Y9QNI2_9BACT|nr:glycosyltransferase 87 family protein [Algoriphagus kandeliae]TFV92365.1 DUF2029 domain-containing protein [Algoriphagus kandeliae]